MYSALKVFVRFAVQQLNLKFISQPQIIFYMKSTIYGGPQVSRQFVLKLRYIKFKIAANKNFMVRIKIFVVAQII